MDLTVFTSTKPKKQDVRATLARNDPFTYCAGLKVNTLREKLKHPTYPIEITKSERDEFYGDMTIGQQSRVSVVESDDDSD